MKGVLYLRETRSVDNELRVVALDDGTLLVTCIEPWAGDEETGFRREAMINLSKAQARDLADFLAFWADK